MAVATLPVIDADGHVAECAETFADRYFDFPNYKDRRPRIVRDEQRSFWVIDDAVFPRLVGPGCHILTTPQSVGPTGNPGDDDEGQRTLSDLQARWRLMQDEGLDLQVVYTTLFLAYPLTHDPGLYAALCRSYNNWMADRCSPMPDKFKWAAVVALDDVASAVEEVKHVSALGAVGVMILGTVGETPLHDRRFWPFYEAVETANLALAIHVGWSCPPLSNMYDTLFLSASLPFQLPILMAFGSLVGGGVLDDFPALRLAFLEAGSEWLPWIVARMSHFYSSFQRRPLAKPSALRAPLDYLQAGNIYLSAEPDDRLLPHVLALLGEDQVIYASDIPHNDREPYNASELQRRPDLSEAVKRKILWDNPTHLYRL